MDRNGWTWDAFGSCAFRTHWGAGCGRWWHTDCYQGYKGKKISSDMRLKRSGICRLRSWLLVGQRVRAIHLSVFALFPSAQSGWLYLTVLREASLIKMAVKPFANTKSPINVRWWELQPRRLIKERACRGLRKPQRLWGHRAVFPSCILVSGKIWPEEVECSLRPKWLQAFLERPSYQTCQQSFPSPGTGLLQGEWNIFLTCTNSAKSKGVREPGLRQPLILGNKQHTVSYLFQSLTHLSAN